MTAWLLRRVLLMIPTLLGITFLTFGIVHLAPGDPVQLSLGGDQRAGGATKEAIAHFRRELRLDEPIPLQYAHWLSRTVRLELGTSWRTGRSVSEQLLERLPVTLGLNGAALFFVYLFGLPLGIMSAVKRGSVRDRLSTVALFLLYSIPSFWLGTMAILLLGGGNWLDWIPVQGLTSPDHATLSPLGKLCDVLWHAVTPVILLGYALLASVSRYMRSGMLEEIGQDYVRTARAKGLSEFAVVYKHALRNSLIPVLSHLGSTLPFVVGGSVIVERLFGLPGMGKLMFDAILARDYSVIMGVSTVTAIFTMVAVLATDVLYALVDPRISRSYR